jgi:hypothetical protein
MAKLYKEKNITGKEYKRAASIIIDNRISDYPVVTFVEETALVIDDKTIQTPCENLVKKITDLNQSIPLLHPETGNVIGSVTFAEIYTALYSAYIFYALERDARLNPNPTINWVSILKRYLKKLISRITAMKTKIIRILLTEL